MDLRPQPTRNVNVRAAYFRGNFVNIIGSNAGIMIPDVHFYGGMQICVKVCIFAT